jgi:hypothetical protein
MPRTNLDLSSTNVEQIIYIDSRNDAVNWKITIYRLDRQSTSDLTTVHGQGMQYKAFTFYCNRDENAISLDTILTSNVREKANRNFSVAAVTDTSVMLGIMCNIVWEFSFTRFIGTAQFDRSVVPQNTPAYHAEMKNHYAVDMVFSMISKPFREVSIEYQKALLPIPPNQYKTIKELVQSAKDFLGSLPAISSLAVESGVDPQPSNQSSKFNLSSIMHELMSASDGLYGCESMSISYDPEPKSINAIDFSETIESDETYAKWE